MFNFEVGDSNSQIEKKMRNSIIDKLNYNRIDLVSWDIREIIFTIKSII